MLKIEFVTNESEATTLKLEGQVVGPWVKELGRWCEMALAAGARLTLDLTDVSFVDREGVALFASLRSQHVAVVNCSPFVREQLRAASCGS